MPAKRKKPPPRATELVKRAKPAPDLPTTPAEAAKFAWDTWRLRRSRHTLDAREHDLRHLGKWLALEHDPLDTLAFRAALELPKGGPILCRRRAQEWIADMEASGLAPTTISRRVSTLRSWLRELADHGLDWQIRLRAPKFDPYQRTRGPSADEVEKVITKLAEDDSAKACRDRALILLLYDQALRRMSALDLDVDRLELDHQRITVRTKNRGDRVMRTISSRTADALRAWLRHRSRIAGPVFCPTWPALVPTRRLAPLTITEITKAHKLGPSHGLRHAAATALRDRGASPFLIQALLQHRNIATTQVYLDETGDEAGRASRILAGEEEIDGNQA